MMEVVLSTELYDVQSSSQIVTTNKPTASFLQAVKMDVLPVAQRTESKH